MVEEARLEELESGLAPATDGWFVVNVRDAAWETNDAFGAMCAFEGETRRSADLGINLRVLRPGSAKWLYHAESTQEDFLVLAGQCLLLVEGEERPLTAWDFVHCPPGTEHAFVATGDRPCVIVMTGAPRSVPAHHRLSALRSSRPPRSRCRNRDEFRGPSVGAISPRMALPTAGRLERIALGVAGLRCHARRFWSYPDPSY